MALNRSQLDLVGKLLRHGSLERAGKILDRLHPGDVSELIESCGPAESRGLVDVLFAPRRARRWLDLGNGSSRQRLAMGMPWVRSSCTRP